MATLAVRSLTKGMLARPLGLEREYQTVVGLGRATPGVIVVHLADGSHFDVPETGQVDAAPPGLA